MATGSGSGRLAERKIKHLIEFYREEEGECVVKCDHSSPAGLSHVNGVRRSSAKT